MDFNLNCSPHRDLIDIIPRLFNLNKLSDVQFIVEDQTIYAHSLVLMGRSEVFEEQMEATCGEKKLISVDGYKYDSFLEFVRYIYTDACEINDDNGLDLLKLAVKYRVIKLENQVINSLDSIKWHLQLFNYVVVDKYEIARNLVFDTIAWGYDCYLIHPDFVTLHPDALNEFLKFNKIKKDVTEMQIVNAVASWLNSYCETHLISSSEARQKFDKQIRNIRFATMPPDEFKQCVKKFPDLLSASDLMSISKQIVLGDNDDLWISECRKEFVYMTNYSIFDSETVFKTTLTVSQPTVLIGLRIGLEVDFKAIEIEISNENGSENLKFTQNHLIENSIELLISLGESIILKSQMLYAINIKYLKVTDAKIDVICRKKKSKLIINDPKNSVRITKASANMLEMFFKLPAE